MLLAVLLAGCQPAPAAEPSTPLTPSPTPAPTSPSPSPTPTLLDLTAPGQAARMVRLLLNAAGGGDLIMVEITTHTASISVLPPDGTEPVTWAYRDGLVQQVDSDLQYVDQASFNIDDFDISDVGRLFRVAARISDSTEQQTLQIVDYSGGRVVMTVTTNPESRTVFFNPDGSLLDELNYHTAKGVTEGLSAVLVGRVAVQRVGVDSETGAWVEYRGPGSTTVSRRRPPKVPLTTVTRDEVLPLTGFPAGTVDPTAIWRVVARELETGELADEAPWSVTIEDRDDSGKPLMYFTLNGRSLVTDLSGNRVSEP